MIRNITITPVLNGFICNVGCQTVVFNDRPSLVRAIDEYFENPEKTEKLYVSRAINRTMDIALAPPTSLAPDCCQAQEANIREPVRGR